MRTTMHITFDTLEMVKRLEAKGFKREQAEEIVAVVKDVQLELSTKTDIEDLKKDIRALKTEIKSDMDAFRTEIRNDMDAFRTEIRSEMKAFRVEIKNDMEDLRKETKSLELRLIIKLGSLFGAFMTLFTVIVGILIIFAK